MKNLVLILAASLGLAGCSAFGLVNAVSPSSHYTLYKDLAYGSHDRQKLDVYVPRRIEANPPVVMFFYGGGWKSGAKNQYEFVAATLTAKGMVVVIPDYRLFPEVVFPEFVEDGATAVRWTADNIADYGGTSGRMHLMGHSAGAHIAALLAYDRSYFDRTGKDEIQIEKLIGLSGPYDFLPLNLDYLEEVFPEASRPRSQPINFVTSKAPPTLLIHGGDDGVVAPGNSERLAAALKAAKVPTELKIYAGVGHARVAAALAPPLGFVTGTAEDSIAFILKGAQVPSKLNDMAQKTALDPGMLSTEPN